MTDVRKSSDRDSEALLLEVLRPRSASQLAREMMAMDYRPDYNELAEVRRWKEEEAYRTFHPARPGVSQMIPHLLRTNAFAVGPPCGMVDTQFAVHRHDSLDEREEDEAVRYTGPQLGQFHKRLLLGLLLQAAGQPGDVTLRFTASEMLNSIGRDVCTANVDALRKAFTELRSATFTVTKFRGDRGEVFGFISDAEWIKRRFTVRMNRRFASALEALGRTYIPMEKRNRLSDGLQTALADVIYATNVSMIQIDDLAELWGREPVQLGRDVTAALVKLQQAEVITSYRRSRGKFHFERGTKY